MVKFVSPAKPCNSFLSVIAVLLGRIMLDIRAVASGKAHHHTYLPLSTLDSSMSLHVVSCSCHSV